VYTLRELTGMLERAGLCFRQAWGGFDGRDYSLDSRRIIVLAEKGQRIGTDKRVIVASPQQG
jgi:hypothetical protein